MDITTGSNDDKQNLKQNSPFKIYFDDKINSYDVFDKKQLDLSESIDFVSNEFYSPKLFKLIQDQLYIIPLWSGIMIHDKIEGYCVKTRLTNNPVENHFGQLKNNIFERKKVFNLNKNWLKNSNILSFFF